MGKPRRKIAAQAEETTTPPTALAASQSIARVDKAQGNNLFTCSLPDGKTILVELETRLRNTIWIISGCYVLIDTKEADARDNKIDGEIVNVVRDERSWRKAPFWYSTNLLLQ